MLAIDGIMGTFITIALASLLDKITDGMAVVTPDAMSPAGSLFLPLCNGQSGLETKERTKSPTHRRYQSRFQDSWRRPIVGRIELFP